MTTLAKARIVNTEVVMNAMLLFAVLAFAGEWFGLSPVFVFTCSAAACIPLSFRLGQATEALGSRLGPVSGSSSTPPSATPPS